MIETFIVLFNYTIIAVAVYVLVGYFLAPKKISFIYKDGGVYKITSEGQTTVSSHSNWK